MSEKMEIAVEAVGYLMLLLSILSMQVKKMQYVVILQSVANLLVVLQFAMRNELSASGVCAIGAVETLALFFINKKGARIPMWFTALFISLGLGVSVVMIVINGFKGVTDVLPMIAVVVFNIAMVQKRSYVSRILMIFNSAIWLSLNIISFDLSLVISYSVLILMAAVGIVRLDRGEWRALFVRLFSKNEQISEEKTEENV